MPLVIVNLSVKVDDESTLAKFESEVSKSVGAILSKPEEWMMIEIYTGVRIYFAASSSPAAKCLVQNIGGYTKENSNKITAALTKLINDYFKIEPTRIYTVFEEKEAQEWGWNGSTLA